ncbi:uncharacterized protein L201_002122 [Kwoniella dendrophila CBS 6074]|uniref:BED-type domain-containing protein n=1 Tax=Kwoniella dendrophila CBS 6074 TaxID=1295534 RepID=A0AAX4JR82_9TREE
MSPPPRPPINQHPSTSSTSSDEPIVIEPPPSRSRPKVSLKPRHSKFRSSSNKSSKIPSSSKGEIGKTLKISTSITLNDEEKHNDNDNDDVDDDDEPVFVGSSMTSLVEKYKMKPIKVLSSRSNSSSRSLSKSPSIVDDSIKNPNEKLVNEHGTSSSSSTSIEISREDKGKGKGKEKEKSKSKSNSSDSIEMLESKPISINRKGKSTAKIKDSKSQSNINKDDKDKKDSFIRTPSLPLLPDLALTPLPIPDWLGRTAILIPLNNCVVCKVRFKKTDSGAAKWRHISTCRPPLYRSPNSPPDLKKLIDEGLREQTKLTSEPTSLLDLHVRQSTSSSVYSSYSTTEDISAIKNKKRLNNHNQPITLGLKNVTNVKATHERLNDDWDNQVKSRLIEFIGPPSSPPPINSELELDQVDEQEFHSPPPSSSAKSVFQIGLTSPSKTDESEVNEIHHLPSTQSLGESSLAQLYAKPNSSLQSPSRSPSKSKSPITPEPNSPESQSHQSISIHSQSDGSVEIPLPPSSQKRSLSYKLDNSSSDDEDHRQLDQIDDYDGEIITKKPFRGWGDSRVEGNLSEINSTKSRILPLGWGGEGIPFERQGGWTGGFA